MWTTRIQPLPQARALKFAIDCEGQPITRSEALQLWQNDAAFRAFCTQTLTATPFSAFRWETPPLTITTLKEPFEFVVLDAPGLQRSPDRKTFAEYFSATEAIVVFPSLGKDSTLIVPSPRGVAVHYVHFASFLRNAPPAQVDTLWSTIGAATAERISKTPLWLNTAGGGVAWLHVRLDQRPKYYWYAPYRESPS